MDEKLKKFPCPQCGADITYAPGKGLACPYCGFERGDPDSAGKAVAEYDFTAYLEKAGKGFGGDKSQDVRCEGCGAVTTMTGETMSSECPYCGSPVVVEPPKDAAIRPEGVIPFAVTADTIMEKFRSWLKGRWFAPNALRKMAARDTIDGVYRPFYTFDAATHSWYKGERGEYYYVKETYSDSEGKTAQREVRKTRWYPSSGEIEEFFDDIVIAAGKPLDWNPTYDLSAVKPYDAGFLSGWRAETPTVALKDAWHNAKGKMTAAIRSLCRKDIGGDEQRIDTITTSYNAVRFKLLLLPLYLSSYRFGGKIYRFQANGQTGEIQGERPYSFWKIFFLVVFLLALVGGGIYLFGR